jgi:hypothetical protein
VREREGEGEGEGGREGGREREVAAHTYDTRERVEVAAHAYARTTLVTHAHDAEQDESTINLSKM